MVQLVRHPQTKVRDTDRLHLNHRATSRLYSMRETSQKIDPLLRYSTPHSFLARSRVCSYTGINPAR